MAIEAPFMKIASNVKLGKNVRFVGYANIYGCEIGDESMIGPFVEIQKGVIVGRFVKIQSHSFICEGVTIEDEVFVGHGVVFVNDKFPRSTTKEGRLKRSEDWTYATTTVKRRASIGSNATILSGLVVGEEAIIGAGSLVTKDVPARAIVSGNPARILRYIDS